MKKAYLILLLTFIVTINAFTQVTTNGGSGLASSYPNLNAAITDLNNAVISSPIVITLAGNETAPVGGYMITAQGTNTNTITVQGASSTITASGIQVIGSLSDAIFKLVGADYVTLKDFTLQENTANTITDAATNNMTEWGIALLYATVTNGAQQCTIQGNTISLNRAYQNTFGIYSNSTHSATVPGTSATASTATGGNSGLKIYSNSINNVNNGITIVGPTAAADHNSNIDIGGTASGTGNTLSNYGTTNVFSTYTNVFGSVSGILIRNSKGINVSNNSITSSSGSTGVISGILRAIYVPFASNPPTGTFTNNFNNNTISLTSHVLNGNIIGIGIDPSISTITSTTNINGNNFTNLNYSIANAFGPTTCISQSGTSTTGPLINNINNNTFTNIIANTAGSFNFIVNSWPKPANASTTVNSNTIVGSFTKTGDGERVAFYQSSNSSPTTATETNTGNNFSNVTVVGSTILDGWQSVDGSSTFPYGPSKTITNNVFSNMMGGTEELNILRVSNSNANGTSTVSGNIISNITSSGLIRGIVASFGSHTITGNTISDFVSSAGAVVIGIYVSTGITQNLLKNKIYNLSGGGANSLVYGISITGSTANIINNLIGNLQAPAANAANPVVGINIILATAVNVRHNTVKLNATSSGALFGSSAISVESTSATVELRNNIFVNTSTPNGAGLTTAYRRYSTSLVSYAMSSNNNLFYAGVPSSNHVIFTDGTNHDQTLAGYKARVMIRDTASITENPSFLSVTGADANFLHINPAIATQIESGGIGGTTDDIDGDIRNATSPDIGADEFNGIKIDLAGPTISYTPLANTSCSTNRVFAPVTIADTSGINMSAGTKPRLYYKKSTHTNTFNDNSNTTNGWKYVEAIHTNGNAFSFTIDYTLLFNGGGVSIGDTIQYFVVAQDLATTPNITLNNGTFATLPTSAALTSANFPISGTINRFILMNSLSGTVTVGGGGTYPTLTGTGGLFEAINNRGIAANVTANIATNIIEPGTIALNAINYSGCTAGPFTLLIKPDAAVTATLTGTVSTGATIKINGADYVTIDGSNSGGSDRNLTIQNDANFATANAVMWLASPATGNGATHNTIKNCIIEGGQSRNAFIGLYIGGSSTISLTATGLERNNNNTIANNVFGKAQYGLVLSGVSAALPDKDNIIINNTIGNPPPGNGIVNVGIYASKQQNLLISGNEVQYVGSGSTVDVYGIRLLDFKRGVCIKNKVHHISSDGGSGGNSTKNYGIAVQSINYATAVNPSNSLIANNFVYTITSSSNSNTWNETGMLASNGYADRYYHNTIHFNGQLSTSVQGMSAAFANGDPYTTGYCTNIDVRNNIINLTGGAFDGNLWAYYTTAPNFNGAIQKNNLLRCDAAGGINNIGYFNGVNYSTLTAWQLATGVDSNSVSIAPVFVLNTVANSNLHLVPGSNTLIDNLGTPVIDVPDDIDGDIRLLATPDLGADEFTSPLCTTAMGGIGSGSTTVCGAFSGTITAANYSVGSGSTYQWVSATNPAGPWTAISGANNPISYIANPSAMPMIYYKLAVGCATNASLDTSSMIAITVLTKPTVYISPTVDTIICAPNSQLLTANTNAATPSFIWLRNNNAIAGATSNTYAANTSGAYRVRVLDSTGCFDTSVAVIVNVLPQPVALTVTATPDTVCLGGDVNLAALAVGGYLINPAGTETFIDIDTAPTVTSIGGLSNESEHNINMPAFTFNGITYTTARVGMNGAIALGSSTGDISASNTALPSTANTAGNILLLPYWDNLTVQLSLPATTIKLDTIGSKFIIQYTNAVHGNIPSNTIKFQVQLDTLTGHIHFVYNDVDFGNVPYDKGNSATVGIQWNSTNAVQYSFNSASLTAGQCISFTPASLTYTWTGPNGFTSSSTNPTLTNITVADSGTYTVAFTNVVAGCTNTASVKVNIKSATTAEWIGAINSDWNTAGNWVCGILPTASSNVIIRSGAPNYPVINGVIDINSLTLRLGAIIAIGTTGDLRINQ